MGGCASPLSSLARAPISHHLPTSAERMPAWLDVTRSTRTHKGWRHVGQGRRRRPALALRRLCGFRRRRSCCSANLSWMQLDSSWTTRQRLARRRTQRRRRCAANGHLKHISCLSHADHTPISGAQPEQGPARRSAGSSPRALGPHNVSTERAGDGGARLGQRRAEVRKAAGGLVILTGVGGLVILTGVGGLSY